jgi:hypothetical protein
MAEAESIMDHRHSDGDYEEHVDARDISDDVELTSSDHFPNQESDSAAPVARKTSRARSMTDRGATADKLDEYFDAQDWALSAIASITESIQQTDLAQNIVTVSDTDSAGSFKRLSSDVDHRLQDDDVFSRPSDADQVRLRISGEHSRNRRKADIWYRSPRTLSSEHYVDRSPERLSRPRLSSSSSKDSSILASNATLTTSDAASPASTNMTVLSSHDFLSPERDRTDRSTRLAEESSDQPDGTYSLRNTPSKRSRRLGLGIQQPASTPKRSWTQEAADYELSLTRRELISPSPSELPEFATSTNLQDDMRTTIPRLDANNLAEASGEPTTNTAPSINNSSVVSVAGTDATTFVKYIKKSMQKKPAISKKRRAYVAFIGDGLCGKTSLIQ